MQRRLQFADWFVLTAGVLLSLNMWAQQEPTYTIRVNSELVQISVLVRDHHGRFVRDLTRNDFTVTEDGRRQDLAALDLETVEDGATTEKRLLPLQLPLLTSRTPPPVNAVRGLRLVVLFFDFTSLAVDEAARSLRAADAYIRTIGPADRVAIVSLVSDLQVQQDFTGDRRVLEDALRRLQGLSRTVLGALGNDAPDSQLFNADPRLRSLRVLANALGEVPQKKSVVLFAGDTGPDSDLVAITATANAAVRAAVSFYAIDASGLAAVPPLGDATRGGSYGVAVLSGKAVAQDHQALSDQGLLYALARGTGGRAFFDSNDLARPFRSLEEDTREYYMLSYRSSNRRHDGRYRRIAVRVRRRGLELKYPAGYYGPHDRARASTRDVERLLREELEAGLPDTSLPVSGFVNYLRTGEDLLYVPITAVLPAESLSYKGTPSALAVGLNVVDGRGRVVRSLRDVIPAGVVTQHPSRPLQYETATELPAGEYNLRFVAVQKDTGNAGSFSLAFRLVSRDDSRISVSYLFSGTLKSAEISSKSPLVLNGSQLVWNPFAEYGEQRPFAIQYQVECGTVKRGEAGCDANQVRSSLQCFMSDQRFFKTEPSPAIVTGNRAVFRIEFAPGSLPPGRYTCRVTAIDSENGAFAFGATQLTIRDKLASPTPLAGSSEQRVGAIQK